MVVRNILSVFIVLLLMKCTTESDRVRLKIHYPFYPGEQYVFSIENDTCYLEYTRLRVEVDSFFNIPQEKKTTYRKILKERSDHSFGYSILKTDSLHPYEGTNFYVDSITKLFVIKPIDNTSWTVIDSMVIPELMYSYRREISKADFKKMIKIVERVRFETEETPDCLDGTTTYLNYNLAGKDYSYEQPCDYSLNKALGELVLFCETLRRK